MLDLTAKQWLFQPIRLLIVDRQPIVLQGLKSVLGAQQDFDVIASSSDATSCLEAIRKLAPDVALVADTLPDLTVSEILAIVRAENLPTRLVFFAEFETDHHLTAAIAAGACSAISKYASPDTMLRSLRLMAKRGVSLEQSDLSPTSEGADGGKIEKLLEQLTQRERQIVRLVSEGMSNKEIARQLNVSQGTVKVHLYNIFQKLEITNRTVLATIALLQRTSAFGTLALAFLAFAIADELKASAANATLPNDGSVGHAGEHAEYEPWKKAILRHRVAWESSETPPHTLRDFLTKVGQVAMGQAASPAAAMDALRAAEQSAISNLWKDHGPVGSSTPDLPAPSLRGIGATQAGNDLAPDHQTPRFAPNPMSFEGGVATFATLAGALIYALQDPHLAAQAHEASNASIGGPVALTGENATTKVAAITDAGAHHGDNAAEALLSQESQLPSALATTDSAAGEGARGQTSNGAPGGNLQPVGLTDPGHGAGLGAYGRDHLIDGNLIQLSPIDSGSSSSAFDFASGSSRINLAAFGTLAWLHMTAASKSIPPHTLAWIYNAATNETILYVNPTDRSLDIGDHGLLEVHLQGIVSVAESNFASQPEAAVVAITLEQLEQALPSAAVINETVQSADNAHATVGAGDSTFGTSGLWSILADDGSKFQFEQTRAGSGGSKSSGGLSTDSADTERSDGACDMPAEPSPVGLAHGAKIAGAEAPALKSEPIIADIGVSPTAQNEMVRPSVVTATEAADWAPGNSSDHRAATSEAGGMEHGNSGHGNSANAEEADESVAPDVAAVDNASHGNSQHTSEPGSAKAAEAQNNEQGNSAHANSASAAQAAGSIAPDAAPLDSASHGNSQHASEPGSAKAAEVRDNEQGNSAHANSASVAQAAGIIAPDAAPLDSASHGNSQHASEPGSAKAAEARDNEQGNSAHADSASVAQAAGIIAPDAAPLDNASHGNSQHASEPGSAKAAEAQNNEQGNSAHADSASAAQAAGSIAPGAAPLDSASQGNSQHASEPEAAKAAGTELVEVGPNSGGGSDNGHQAPASAAATASAAVTAADQADHGNSGHDIQTTSGNPPQIAELVERSDAAAGNAGSNSQHTAELGPVTAAATELAEADPTPGNGGGNDNGHPDRASVAATASVTAADQADHGNIGHDIQTNSGNPPQVAELVEPSDAVDGNAGGSLQHAEEHGSAKAALTALAEADPTPGNDGGNGNGHSDPASDAADASATTAGQAIPGNSGHDAQSTPANMPETASLVQPSDAIDGNAADYSQHVAQSAAVAGDAAQPTNSAPETGGADQELAFRFDTVTTPPAVVAIVKPQELDDLINSHVPPGQVDVLEAVVKTVPDASDAHAANHGTGASHHAIAPAAHDLLV